MCCPFPNDGASCLHDNRIDSVVSKQRPIMAIVQLTFSRFFSLQQREADGRQ